MSTVLRPANAAPSRSRVEVLDKRFKARIGDAAIERIAAPAHRHQ
jgi:hypothetical protein